MPTENPTTREVPTPRSSEVFQQLFASSPDALIVAQPDGLILWANTSAVQWLDLLEQGSDHLPRHLLENGEVETPDGRTGEARILEFDWRGQKTLLVSIRDITFRQRRERALIKRTRQLESLNANLEHLAHFDPLTSALNRRGLERKLDLELLRARRDGSTAAAILVDFDNFKDVNQKFGHAVADRVLMHVTRIFKSLLRPQDLVARIGGDEFLLILPDTREAEAMRVAERLRSSVERQPYNAQGGDVPVTISLGLTRVAEDQGGISQVLADARHALAMSKSAGKNCVGLAHQEAGSDQTGFRQVLDLLRGATRIRPVSLPIRDLETGKVVGQEILSRGSRGPFEMPVDLFHACPDEGVEAELDLICLKSCLKAAIATIPADQCIHVNVLPTTLQNLDTAVFLEAFPSPLPRNRFCIEISEQHVIGDPAKLRPVLQELRQEGLLLAIDDVGFGRSSLEALVLLEPDIIKIARRFGRGAAQDRGLHRSLERLARIAGALGARCIVEGLENDTDLAVARDLNIPLGQGFLWGRPQPL